MKKRVRLTPAQIVVLSFFLMIAVGAALLMLPFSTREGVSPPLETAVFTATSAACVTGLVIQDTAQYWSAFGQGVILCLIQVGGMGVVTMAVVVMMFSGKKIGLRSRWIMQESILAPQVGGIVKMARLILTITLAVEGAGALLLAFRFCPEFGLGRGIWYAVFHSVSAFCNAGFDLMGVRGKFSSLTSFAADPVINLAIMGLIVSGGIGFLTWYDIRTKKFRLREYRMQSKAILTVTALLILLPALGFFFLEFAGLPTGERIWCSLFQSVTPRTAGFNTADLTKLSDSGAALTIILMLIGGSPGSTAGGMKTTTLAVIIAAAAAVFRRRSDAHFFGRRISADTVRSAAAIMLMYLVLFMAGGMAISRVEGIALLDCLFETASAIGTVGLSMGITPGLSLASRGILVFLMFFGRVGGLTLIFAAVSGDRNFAAKLPQERITVG